MNKNELIDAIAEKIDLNKTDTAQAIEAVFSVLSKELQSGGEIRIANFGTFLVTERKATTGRNPRTGEAIDIAATNVPKFRPSKILKETVNS